LGKGAGGVNQHFLFLQLQIVTKLLFTTVSSGAARQSIFPLVFAEQQYITVCQVPAAKTTVRSTEFDKVAQTGRKGTKKNSYPIKRPFTFVSAAA